ncbi:uncharacterized protein ACA1_218700 [Acanthamoeba castellanii str. Neff]|uniref:Uncharacterized protein n=1 Tax=Acanthamoeba castellanii (strain ATCC 30010 / Neff) TaxID=1257118 RepID=L8GQF1_ACACF|nr:uncharacterized protein ACA1_218700 [Acanthamoeba castellanii str. Neff]ELR15215.1 hypothetical protein ACA1_218700 [Acanthamoeba castellanii str. Neff]
MADEAGHIALQVGQAPDTDLERQIAEMKRKWQELQQALASTSSTTTSSSTSSSSFDPNPDTSSSSPQQQRQHQHHRTVNTRRSSARRPSPPSSRTSPSLKEATAQTTPHLLVEGKDQEADDHQQPEANNNNDHHHQQQRNDENGNQSEEDDDEEEDASEGDVDGNDSDIDSDNNNKKRRKKRSGGGSSAGGKRRRMSYSYNVDDRKAWRKRQVGIDGLTDEERWTQRMSELEAFKERFGHVNVPQKWHENQKLANWLKNVRQRWTHVANYLTPDKEHILAELGVKKCEPLDIIIAKAKGRGGGSGGGGKRKRSRASSSSSTSASADDDLASSDGGEAEAASSSGEATQEKKIQTPTGSSKDEGRKDVEEDDVERLPKRRRSAPEPREIENVKKGEEQRDEDEPRGQPEQQDAGPRRSGRKRKPLFDLEHLDLHYGETKEWWSRYALDRGQPAPARRQRSYQIDVERGIVDQVYGDVNIVLRRKPKENNFKAILHTIRDLMNSPAAVPAWLHDVFLGYGDPAAARGAQARGWIDFRDTFLDYDHLRHSFPGLRLAPTTDDEAALRPPFQLRFPEADGGSSEGGAEPGTVEVRPYTQKNRGPYPYDQPKRNAIPFTPKQVTAIRSAMNEGLTMVVGPPGTGKTDVAVQVISNWYHNYPDQRILLITHSNQALNQLFEKIMALDIDERHLLRLGHGQKLLETEKDFGKYGRVEWMLQKRLRNLELVQKLARAIGAEGDFGWSCESAAHLYSLHVRPAWDNYKARLGAADPADPAAVAAHFPFARFFDDLPDHVPGQPLFAGVSRADDEETARGCFRHIRALFTHLDECRPLELLRTGHDRADFLLIKQARIMAIWTNTLFMLGYLWWTLAAGEGRYALIAALTVSVVLTSA